MALVVLGVPVFQIAEAATPKAVVGGRSFAGLILVPRGGAQFFKSRVRLTGTGDPSRG